MLSALFASRFPISHSVSSGIFHSISAFNTAGFSVYQDSFCKFCDDIPVNMLLIIISTLGSLGFFVIYDIVKITAARMRGIKNRKLSVHSRLVLICTAAILFCGSAIVFFTENWDAGMPPGQQALISLFQVSSASSTTGFNSVDIGRMQPGNLFLFVMMMFVGAGSGGTAGGIKMTTFAVALLSVHAILASRGAVNVFKRRLPFEIVRNSFAILMLSLLWVVAASCVMAYTEKKEFLGILFEVTSAIGTVGLSTGITPGLSVTGKIFIILSMFIGRVGPLGIGISMLKNKEEPEYRYATTDIFIG